MAESGNPNDVWVSRVNDDSGDRLGCLETNMRPRFASIDRFIGTITVRDISTDIALAGSRINSVGIRWRDGDRANRA